MGMLAAQHQPAQPLGRVVGEREADPAAHRIAPVVGLRQFQGIEDGNDVGGVALAGIGGAIVRLVTLPVPTRVDQDHPTVVLQAIDVARHPPVGEALAEAMLEDQGRAIALDLVVDAYAVIGCGAHETRCELLMTRISAGPELA